MTNCCCRNNSKTHCTCTPPSSFYASPSKGGRLCHSAFCHLAARFTFRACRDKNCQGINSDKWKKLRPCPKFQLSVTCFFQDCPTTQWGKSRHSVLGNARTRTQERGGKACQLANSTNKLPVLVVLELQVVSSQQAVHVVLASQLALSSTNQLAVLVVLELQVALAS